MGILLTYDVTDEQSFSSYSCSSFSCCCCSHGIAFGCKRYTELDQKHRAARVRECQQDIDRKQMRSDGQAGMSFMVCLVYMLFLTGV